MEGLLCVVGIVLHFILLRIISYLDMLCWNSVALHSFANYFIFRLVC